MWHWERLPMHMRWVLIWKSVLASRQLAGWLLIVPPAADRQQSGD
jgi:hypothetical protein